MITSLSLLLFTSLVFLLAGLIKGVIGLGLPTVAIGLMSLFMTPVEAAAILVMPSLMTNVWQALVGPHLMGLLRRLWPMLLGTCAGTYAASGILTGANSGLAVTALGGALVIYALIGLTPLRLTVPPRWEVWLGPLVGLATGVVTAATGVFVIPAVPYLQALGFEKDELVQALGLYFLVSTVALAAVVAQAGSLPMSWPVLAVLAAVALVAALIGMALGQRVRAKVRPALFRVCFFVGLLLLGLHLSLRPFL
jgi:uncharacterized membrane protein YfcA